MQGQGWGGWTGQDQQEGEEGVGEERQGWTPSTLPAMADPIGKARGTPQHTGHLCAQAPGSGSIPVFQERGNPAFYHFNYMLQNEQPITKGGKHSGTSH